ncbi:hypothetical protein DSO57_1026071 [Entomophthora muscae]|uniref:Uncharacterized protein n=1 Tax=Entomophthora muscae TaxID=34485 RepID=A0ACC2UBM6_9FUNG|nr:hypothetical protein DSO57_1026071 [Entomophthora muscae]
MMGDGSSNAIPVGVHDQKKGVEQAVSPLPIGSEPLSAIQADYELERKLFVSNIPAGTTLDQLCQEMRFAGPVQKVSLEYRDNQLAGYGFVTFRDNLGVKAALEIFSKKTFNGNLLSLERTCETSELEPPVKDIKNVKMNNKNAKGARSKTRTSHKFPVPSHNEVSIYDLVRQGPPPSNTRQTIPSSSIRPSYTRREIFHHSLCWEFGGGH